MKKRVKFIGFLSVLLLVTFVISIILFVKESRDVTNLSFNQISDSVSTSEMFNNISCQKSGNANIQISNGVVTIRTTSRVAGAIDSIKFKNKETVNSFDHGRQVQYAFQLNGYGECLNPTEAGSAADNQGESSTSKFIEGCQITQNKFYTKSQMAYWLRPGDTGYCEKTKTAINTTIISNYTLSKIVETDYKGNPELVKITAKLDIPEYVTSMGIEAPTGYHKTEFANFYSYNVQTQELKEEKISDPLYGPFYFTKSLSYPLVPVLSDGKTAIVAITKGLPSFAKSYTYNMTANKPYEGAWCIVDNKPAGCVGYGSFCGADPNKCEGVSGKTCCNNLWPSSSGVCLCANPEKTAAAKWSVAYYMENINKGSYIFETFMLISDFSSIKSSIVKALADINGVTPSPTVTTTATPYPSPTLSPTPTLTPTQSITPSPTITTTATPYPSPTLSPTLTPTQSITPSPTITTTATPYPSPTLSPTLTPTQSITPSPTITVSTTTYPNPRITVPITSPTPTSTPKTTPPGSKQLPVVCGGNDHNLDGKVDVIDFGQFVKVFGKKCSDTGSGSNINKCGAKDFDSNQLINIVDFFNFTRQMGSNNCN